MFDVHVDIPKYTNVTNWENLFLRVFNEMLNFGVVLAILMIVYSGLRYITAGSDTNAPATAKKNLIWAIIGLVILMLAKVIVVWANMIFAGQWSGVFGF
jgi:hypothetical protein